MRSTWGSFWGASLGSPLWCWGHRIQSTPGGGKHSLYVLHITDEDLHTFTCIEKTEKYNDLYKLSDQTWLYLDLWYYKNDKIFFPGEKLQSIVKCFKP